MQTDLMREMVMMKYWGLSLKLKERRLEREKEKRLKPGFVREAKRSANERLRISLEGVWLYLRAQALSYNVWCLVTTY